ncbi:MAG: protein NirI, partial [Acidobacteria bacterium]|nr:protein NirI [Acidobacteriota bacterium]
MRLALALALLAALAPVAPPAAAETTAAGVAMQVEVPTPDPALAAALLGVAPPVTLARDAAGVPGWTARKDGRIVGFLGSTWEIAGSTGYSGRPIDVLVAVTPEGRIAGARLVRQEEPVLTLGISEADIAAYVDGFAGVDLARPRTTVLAPQDDLPDVISRATVSTGVIRDGILRTARTLAIGRGAVAGGGGVDRVGFAPRDWAALLAEGALVEGRMTMDEAARALAGAEPPVEPGPGDFIRVWAGLIDPPTVGRNLLGQQVFTRAIGALGPGESALALISAGLYSPRGAAWRSSGRFDRLAIV